MTVTQPIGRTSLAHSGEHFGDRLEPIHRRWLGDLQVMLDKVDAKDADIWPRWNAIRYIDTVFSGQFDRERAAIEKLSGTLGEKHMARLWVAGELIALVRWQLRHSVGLCHHAGDFAAISTRLLKAAEHWFSEVEEFVGPVSWAELPMQARHDLSSIDSERASCWSELPIALATSL